ncbi:hypothetical protein M7I_3214 [Glarea lozoyensis 74030]|uniref:Uncharacterized protein n=1 Tax=Glarea lozoyensis (strain ATCC 74030 / MF5533) TaxID=1104152 RepID=H0EKY0_GLAL7|nr:hypothetical protein M7I_3214 [Glarea lozoyensis 74030]
MVVCVVAVDDTLEIFDSCATSFHVAHGPARFVAVE